MFQSSFSEGNEHVEFEENNSNDTLDCDDDAHKQFCVLVSQFPFLYEVGITQDQGKGFKDTAHNKRIKLLIFIQPIAHKTKI